MVETVGSCLLACSKLACGNSAVVLVSGQPRSPIYCQRCGAALEPILRGEGLAPYPRRSSLEDELARRAKLINLPVKIADFLPGPVALEYVRFRDLLLDGRIEASCWKLMNLIEVAIVLLFAAAAEEKPEIIHSPKGIHTIGKKTHLIRQVFERPTRPESFLNYAKTVVDWRNVLGIGHGSLAANREPYVRRLLEFATGLEKALKDYQRGLSRIGCSLTTGENAAVVGPEYGFSKPVTLSCLGSKQKNMPPVLCLAYQFDPLDVYFLDFLSFNGTYRYRNFARNRNKYFSKGGKLLWREDPKQVSWLDVDERLDWAAWADSNRQRATTLELPTILAKGTEQFQRRGMNTEARWCLGLMDTWSGMPFPKKYEAIYWRTRFYIKASAGEYGAAEKAYEKAHVAIGAVKNGVGKYEGYWRETDLRHTAAWFKGVRGKIDVALSDMDECRSLLAEKLADTHPFTVQLRDLELRKDALFVKRRSIPHLRPADIDECNQIIHLASRLLDSDPGNYRLVDVIAWTINLRWEISGRLQLPGNDHEVRSALDYAEKIRKRAYRHNSDVWTRRGYAWSKHVRARFEKSIGSDNTVVWNGLQAALDVRRRTEERFPTDLGVKEDIIKNLLELLVLARESGHGETGLGFELRERAAALWKKEGDTPHMEGLLHSCRQLGLDI